MEGIRIYNDLLINIETAERILENTKENLRKIDDFYKLHKWEGCPTMDAPGRSSYLDADTIHGSRPELRYDILEKAVMQQRQYESMQELQEGILENLNREKEVIEKNLSTLEGLHERIYYLHYVKNKPFAKIAEELGYSEIHIYRKHYELKKMISR